MEQLHVLAAILSGDTRVKRCRISSCWMSLYCLLELKLLVVPWPHWLNITIQFPQSKKWSKTTTFSENLSLLEFLQLPEDYHRLMQPLMLIFYEILSCRYNQTCILCHKKVNASAVAICIQSCKSLNALYMQWHTTHFNRTHKHLYFIKSAYNAQKICSLCMYKQRQRQYWCCSWYELSCVGVFQHSKVDHVIIPSDHENRITPSCITLKLVKVYRRVCRIANRFPWIPQTLSLMLKGNWPKVTWQQHSSEWY